MSVRLTRFKFLIWNTMHCYYMCGTVVCLTYSDLSSDLTVVGGLYQQRLGAKYFGAANYLPTNVDAVGHTLTNALYQALTTSS